MGLAGCMGWPLVSGCCDTKHLAAGRIGGVAALQGGLSWESRWLHDFLAAYRQVAIPGRGRYDGDYCIY